MENTFFQAHFDPDFLKLLEQGSREDYPYALPYKAISFLL